MIGLLHLEADYVEKWLSFFCQRGVRMKNFERNLEKSVSSEHPRKTATPVHCVYLVPPI